MSKNLFAMLCCAALFSCSSKPAALSSAPANPAEVVASVNDLNITAGELTEAAKNRLQRVEQDIYEIKKDTLDGLVETKLIEQAAKKQGKSVDDYLKESIDDKAAPPSDDEIKSFYEARKDQIGNKTLKEVSDQIKTFLTQNKKQGLRQQLIGGLRAAANIKISLVQPRVNIEAGDNPSIGPKNAPVTIIEFTDYQCPFCGRVRPTIAQITDEYKDKVRYVLRDFPLSFHQYSKKSHEAAHCAGDQGKYWEYNKELWGHQQALQVEKLKEYAKSVGLNTKKFDECLDESKYAKKVEENVAAGSEAGAQGTPSFFINGIFLSGARPLADFKAIIDEELKK
ncbi:MAG: thioredoxin domain-containing protein [Deltaproteobacteria bacterium]|nr:thioredoxin domain-containing protein [Deltaproteobacteria bacterium]MBI2974150.1 thioredoxin domain-containing protein [Deltaproteobacteria bacterium]